MILWLLGEGNEIAVITGFLSVYRVAWTRHGVNFKCLLVISKPTVPTVAFDRCISTIRAKKKMKTHSIQHMGKH